MKIFEMVFGFFLLITVVILSAAVAEAWHGKRRAAGIRLAMYGVLLCIYMATLMISKFTLPVNILTVGERQYSGDWSLGVEGQRRYPLDREEYFEVDFSVSNVAGSDHRETGLVVYMVDENGVHHRPSESTGPSFDVLVKPGQKVSMTRTFHVPSNVQRLNLFVVREGFHVGWFVIGRASFDGRTAVHIL